MVQQSEVLLRDFIGYHQNRIMNLDIESETHAREARRPGTRPERPRVAPSWSTA